MKKRLRCWRILVQTMGRWLCFYRRARNTIQRGRTLRPRRELPDCRSRFLEFLEPDVDTAEARKIFDSAAREGIAQRHTKA